MRLTTLSKLVLATVLASSAGGCVLHAHGRIGVPVVIVEEPPPPPPPRPVIEVRPGFIWIDGYHRWDGHRYVWMDGHYERERAGHVWHPGRWERRGRGHVWVEGQWRASGARDRDRAKVRDHRDGH